MLSCYMYASRWLGKKKLTEQRIDCSAWTPTPTTDGGIGSVVRVQDWRNVATDNTARRSFGEIIFSASELLELAVASVCSLPAAICSSTVDIISRHAKAQVWISGMWVCWGCGRSWEPRHFGQLPWSPRLEHRAVLVFTAESIFSEIMAPMGIRLSPLGVAVFCLLGVGVIYHLYSGVISNRLAAFR